MQPLGSPSFNKHIANDKFQNVLVQGMGIIDHPYIFGICINVPWEEAGGKETLGLLRKSCEKKIFGRERIISIPTGGAMNLSESGNGDSRRGRHQIPRGSSQGNDHLKNT